MTSLASVAFPMATASASGLTQYATNAEATAGAIGNPIALNPSNLLSITQAIITDADLQCQRLHRLSPRSTRLRLDKR